VTNRTTEQLFQQLGKLIWKTFDCFGSGKSMVNGYGVWCTDVCVVWERNVNFPAITLSMNSKPTANWPFKPFMTIIKKKTINSSGSYYYSI